MIGINTAIYSPSGGSVGIAFDIPADTAKRVAEQLKSKGVVNRGWIGIVVQPVTADIADSLGMKNVGRSSMTCSRAARPRKRACAAGTWCS